MCFNRFGGFPGPSRGMGKKIFVGRLPQEATAEDLRQYFGRFGRILDVYVPKVIFIALFRGMAQMFEKMILCLFLC